MLLAKHLENIFNTFLLIALRRLSLCNVSSRYEFTNITLITLLGSSGAGGRWVAYGGVATLGPLLWMSWYVEVASLSGTLRASPYELIHDFPTLELLDTLVSVAQRADLGEPDARLHLGPRHLFTPI